MSDPDLNDPRDEALWQLLGRARTVEPSPYFARRVLRAVEAEAAPRPGWFLVFLRNALPVTVCAALAVIAMAGIRSSASTGAVAGAEIEFEAIQNLDLLVVNDESSLWLAPSSPY